MRSSIVGGSVQVKQGGAAETTGSQVTGDIQYDQQAGPLRIADNVVGGSVQVVANRSGIEIVTNTIDGNLQCKENTFRPSGGGNLVHGNAEHQCAGLADGPGAPTPADIGSRADDDPDARVVTLRPTFSRGPALAFHGRVRGAGAGVGVVLQSRRSDRWRVDRDRTNRSGAFRVARRFVRGPRARTVSLRALVRRQAGWPARSVSDVVRIRIPARSA